MSKSPAQQVYDEIHDQLLALEAVVLQLSVALDTAGVIPTVELLDELAKTTRASQDPPDDIDPEVRRRILQLTGRMSEAIALERSRRQGKRTPPDESQP